MDITEQSPIILSLCPGIRGIERGLERVFRSVRVAAYVEIETFIVENLLTAFEAGLVDAAPIWTNLKTFNPHPFRNRIDGIIGGYPCQPFSLAGNRGGQSDPRHLWPFIHQIIEKSRPTWCFFENVRGHLSMGYSEVYRNLRDLGYRVESGIYSAEEVGAPHQRDRLFILAVMEDSTFFGERRWSNGNPQRSRCQNKAEGSVGSLEYSGCKPLERGSVGGKFDSEGREVSHGPSDQSDGPCELGHPESFNKWNEWNDSVRPEGENRRSDIKLGNSGIYPLQEWKIERGVRTESFRTGNCKEVADSTFRRCEQCQQATGCICKPNQGCCEMAYPCNDGQNGSENRKSIDQGEGGDQAGSYEFFKSEGFGNYGPNDRFPTGQGEYQHEWEEPRTIESSLVYTIDGYNFAEDLHRAIGNSVVEQTAELAFRDLLSKHFPIKPPSPNS